MKRQCWIKSSYSGASGGNCIEVADDDSRVMVRDSKNNQTGPILRFSPEVWRRFADRVKRERSLADLWPIL
jgi:hypothetical protein